MNMRIVGILSVLSFAFSSLGAAAAPLDFDANPIDCSATVGGGLPMDCTPFALPRPDGYEIVDATFSWGFPNLPPPPPFPPPPPDVDAWGSDRDFINPAAQDLIIFIFGETAIDVMGGPPVMFFASGTLDGVVKVTFSTVTGSGPLVWNVAALIPDVPAGVHTLDMEFGVVNITGQQRSGTFSSILQVRASAVPTPGTTGLLLGGLLVLLGIPRSRSHPSFRRRLNFAEG